MTKERLLKILENVPEGTIFYAKSSFNNCLVPYSDIYLDDDLIWKDFDGMWRLGND